MRLLVFFAVVLLLLGALRLGLELAVEDLVRRQMDALNLGRTAQFGSLDVDLPNRLGLRDLKLIDPEDGAVLATVDRLNINLALEWGAEYPAYVKTIEGRGGRVEVRTGTPSVLGVPLVRALVDLVGAIVDLIPEDEPGQAGAGPPPPLVLFHDVEVVVWSPSKPVMRYPCMEVDVLYNRETGATTANVTPLETGGKLTMVFRDGGLDELLLDDMLVGPALELMAGEGWGEDIASVFAPLGRVDLHVVGIMSDRASLGGELRDADLDAPGVPFPLHIERLTFQVDGDQLNIEPTRVEFPGGSASVFLTGSLDSLDISINIEDNAFHQSYLSLLPGWDQLSGLHCEDAGSFDLSLRLVFGAPGGRFRESDPEQRLAPRVSGGGGFHLEHAWLADPRIDVYDLMGRLTVSDDALRIAEVSATVAGGRVRATGDVGLEDGHFSLDLLAEDIDIEAAHDVIHPLGACGNDFAGWLSGSLEASGSIDDIMASKAKGSFRVFSGQFMESNLITSIFRRAAVDGGELREDQRLGAEFNIKQGHLNLETLAVDLGSLGLTGTGWIDQNGRISLELVLVRSLDGALGDVIGFLQNNLLVQVEVRGTLNQPDVRTYPVAVITRSLSQAVEFFARAFGEGEDG
ncbi:MAG: hypothetical protein DRQ55_02085 [Planctomycetota bacterium]|nr:MAG: hypothetical protein DRQ55_02085 [Planctomycetota bacterium]